MKPLQSLLTIIVLVGLIFGVAFGLQYLNNPPTAVGPASQASSSAAKRDLQLTIPVDVIKWEPASFGFFETHQEYHHDFWFINPHDLPIEIGVDQKNCKCLHVALCTFSEPEAERYKAWQIGSAAALFVRGNEGPMAILTQQLVNEGPLQQGYGARPEWKKIAGSNDSMTAPPKHHGLVRVSWKGEKPGDDRISATLWTQVHGDGPSPRFYPRLEVPVTYVPPVMILPGEGRIEDLYPRSSKSVDFVAFAVARAEFDLTAWVQDREQKPDPCFRCTVLPMTDEERERAAAQYKARMLSARRIHVEVMERLSDTVQLDLGPFRRRVHVKTDVMEELPGPIISGTVRGEITVGNPEDQDKITLGSFRSSLGKKQRLILTTTEPGIELLTDEIEHEPPFLKVTLKKQTQRSSIPTWELEVEVPPNVASGPFPGSSAIYVKVKSNPPRRIRIPVTGTAYR